jgi:predicted transcriptional regulator
MEPPFQAVELDAPIEVAFKQMASGAEAMLVLDHGKPVGVLTKIDMISFTRYW